MIQGLAKFKEYFNKFSDDYVIIGGLATALLMNDYGFLARATKDIDMVVIAKENEEFLKHLLFFIDEAGYKTRQKTQNDSRRNLFRFFDGKNKDFPEQLELFAVHDEHSIITSDRNILPIKTPEFYNYLSAILLDKDYFDLLVNHTTKIDSLNVANPEILILLKVHAHMNLKETQHHYDEKHLKDVIKLTTLLDGENFIFISGKPKNDFLSFLPILQEVEEQRMQHMFKSMNASGFEKEMIISLLSKTFKYDTKS